MGRRRQAQGERKSELSQETQTERAEELSPEEQARRTAESSTEKQGTAKPSGKRGGKDSQKRSLRWVSVAIFAALTIVCGCLIPRVVVNYDMTKYLPEDSISKAGYEIYSEEFGGTHMAKIMVYTESKSSENYLQAFESCMASSEGAITGVTLAGEKDSTALFVINFSGRGVETKVHTALDAVKREAGESAVVCGTVIDDLATVEYMASSAFLASVILVPVILLLVLLTTKSFMSLLLVLLTLGVSIVLNMGTNSFLPDVSFITQGITLALQLAITLDYAIFMIHEYERQRASGAASGPAVRAAVKKSFTSIFSACLTTLAGFIALMFMRMTIGMDIGIVFIKGVALSFASVLLLLPSLLLIFDKAIAKTSHRPLMPKFEKSARGLFKARYVFVFLVFLLVPAIIMQSKITFTFGSAGLTAGDGVPSYDAKLEIAEIYGKDNSVVLVFPKQADRSKELALTGALNSLKFGDGRPMFRTVMSGAGVLTQVEGAATARVQELVRQFGAMIQNPDLANLELNLPFCGTAEEYTGALVGALRQAGISDELLAAFMTPENIEQITSGFTQALAYFDSDSYTQIILSADTLEENAEAFAMYDAMLESVREAGFEEFWPVGETPSAVDMRDIMTADNLWVNVLSIGLVFLIIAIAFRSVSFPIVLIVPILTGIYINSAIPAVMGTPIAFLGNLVVSMIQLGATIDYAILYANKYSENRRSMQKREASQLALKESIPSILTSAVALTVAGFSIGWTAVLPATAQIGFMLGRAGLLSAFLTIFVLPGLLCLFDPILQKTSWKLGFLPDPSGKFARSGGPEEDDDEDE